MVGKVNPNPFPVSSGGNKVPLSSKAKTPKKSPFSKKDLEKIKNLDTLVDIPPDNLTPNGKIPVIITSKNRKALKKLKKNIYKHFSPEEAKVKDKLELVDGVKVEVDPYNLKKLIKYIPKGSSVVLDKKIPYPTPDELRKKLTKGGDPTRPAFDIANSTLGINLLWEKGYTGKGMTLCVIDSGIYPHPDLKDKIKVFVDMAEGKNKPYDPYGHGTHVAGIAVGTGKASEGKFRGVAPDADLVGVRITSVSEAIKGIQWAIKNKDKYNIKVINLSLGDFPLKSYKDDPWAQAVEKAWDAGIVVVVAAGNEGPGEGTISTPGYDPKVITVGAMDDKNTPERSDDTIARFSSRGPTTPDGLDKPDVVAPGVEIFGPLSPNSTLDTPDLPHYGKSYIAISGSSQATAIVSGLALLLCQSNPKLTPNDIKKIIKTTADKYLPNVDKYDEGSGLVDPIESLQVALGTKKPKPSKVKNEKVPMLLADNSTLKRVRRRKKNSSKLTTSLTEKGNMGKPQNMIIAERRPNRRAM